MKNSRYKAIERYSAGTTDTRGFFGDSFHDQDERGRAFAMNATKVLAGSKDAEKYKEQIAILDTLPAGADYYVPGLGFRSMVDKRVYYIIVEEENKI